MRVFDITKTQELEEYDLTKGRLMQDTLVKVIPEQLEQEEISHYITLAEFENGGKSVEKVIDKEYVPYTPEKEEVEEIQVYIEYTADELAKIQKEQEIAQIERWFNDYDRICIEHSRCQRLGLECHHNIDEWDSLAVQNATRLKELRTTI